MLHLSIRRIEVFIAVADAGSFSAAAARLGISQPSVSDHIRALEEGVGETLLERRRGQSAQLTPAGEALLGKARRLLAQAVELTSQISQGKETRRSRIVIAAQRRISNAVLPRVLTDFAQAHPQIELVVRSGSMEEVLAMLRGGVADVGYFLSNEGVGDVPSTVVSNEPYIFVVGLDHPLAARKRIAPSELASHRFIRGAKGSMLGRAVDQLLSSIGLDKVDVLSRSTDDGVIHQFLVSGLAIHFTLEKSVEQDLRNRTIRKLPVVAPPLTLAVRQALSPRQRPLPATRAFCRHVEQHWPR